MKRNTSFLLILLLAATLLISFQSPTLYDDGFLTHLKQKLNDYNQQMPQEKVYLQVDKPFYKPGEDIWFSAFVVNGLDHQPSTTSQVVYVELINPKGGVEKLLTLPLYQGRGQGDFALDAAAPGGVYKIRAYTLWMKNFSEEAFFEKTVQVQKVLTPRLLLKVDFERKAYGPSDQVVATFEAKDLQNNLLSNQTLTYFVQLQGKAFKEEKLKTDKQGKCKVEFSLPDSLRSADGLLNIVVDFEGQRESISRSIPIVLNKIDLQFFPEGGELVENLSGRVAFKALNEFGKPADVSGIIIDEQSNTVQHFESFHHGMGAFVLKPQPNHTYRAKLIQPKGITRLYNLPLALPKGYTLAVDTLSKGMLNVSFHAPVAKEVHLVVQVRGRLLFSRQIQAQVGNNPVAIPLKDFPVGIAQVTLFDHNQLARCERLVFVNAQKKLTIKISSDKKDYRPREKVELTIQTLDEDSLPIPASLALSVVDDQLISFADDKQDNILSSLLMSTDLKGKVEEPSFYFKKDEPKATRALDYVLMTHGWRRFTWANVLEEQPKISYYPEKFGTISGTVFKSDKRHAATVTLFELGNQQRAAQVRTNPDGTFTFLDIDPTSPIQLFAHARLVKDGVLRIQLDQNSVPAVVNAKKGKAAEPEPALLNKVIQEKAVPAPDRRTGQLQPAELTPIGNNNLSLKADVQALSEVVVVGYGTQKRSDIVGSVSYVSSKDLIATLPIISVEQALQGRVAGVQVISSANTSGEAANVRIRGSRSTLNEGPLYIVDGFPLATNLSESFSTLGFLSPDNIQRVEVLKSAAAVAIYGSQAVNGVIIITTKNAVSQPYYPYRRNQSNTLSTAIVQPRNFTQVREFYSPQYDPAVAVEERNDFRSTLFWNPRLQTDQHGTAKVSFYNSDELTSFRVTVEGIGRKLVGREEYTYFTQQPIQLDAKIPPYLTFEDIIHLPVRLKNNSQAAIQGTIRVTQSDGLQLEPYDSILTLLPNQVKTWVLNATVLPISGKGKLTIAFHSAQFSDVLTQEMDIQPKGFPTIASFSEKALDKTYAFRINEPVPGSLKAELKAYPDIIGDLMAGIESVLREPYGCFEQTSASTYPNVLALQYLRETRTANPEIEAKALQYIERGYKRLAGFETSQHGFEWYGHTPPHEGLTAFGLMEFLEMKKVYDGVSDKMIDRTQTWLLSRREGDGSFKQNAGKYGFSAASKTVNNAYLVYALSEAGLKNIEKEYAYAYQEALQSKDAYRTALLANASFNFNEKAKGEQLLTELERQMNEVGLGNLKAEPSIVVAYGKSLQVEVAAMFTLALLKADAPRMDALPKLVQFIVSSRIHGGFGSTQATILALKALTEYAKFSKKTIESGKLALYLNNELIDSKTYIQGTRGEIVLTGIERFMKPGMQQFKVAFEETKEALPYSLNVTWNSYTPNASADCRVDVETKLLAPQVKTGQTVRLTTIIKNKSSQGVPMTVALVGIPSGLSPQPWQLKELQEKGLVDFYEVRQNYVVFYYRELGPKAIHQLHLDLKAEVPGVYQAAASSAYLYYTDEHKDWEAGEKVEVMP